MNVQRPTQQPRQGGAPARDRVATVGVWIAVTAVLFSPFSLGFALLLGLAALVVGFISLARAHETHSPAKGLAVLAGAGGVLAIIIGSTVAPAPHNATAPAPGGTASQVALASPTAPAPTQTYTYRVTGTGGPVGVTWPTSSAGVGSTDNTSLPWSVAVPISGDLSSYNSVLAHYDDVNDTSAISCTITDQTGTVVSRNDSPAGVGSVDCQVGGQNFTASPVLPAPSSSSDSSSGGGPYVDVHHHSHVHVCVGHHIRICS